MQRVNCVVGGRNLFAGQWSGETENKDRNSFKTPFPKQKCQGPRAEPSAASGDALLSPSHVRVLEPPPGWQQEALGTVLLGDGWQILLTGPDPALLRGTLYIQVQNIQALEERKGRAKAGGERAEEEGEKVQ